MLGVPGTIPTVGDVPYAVVVTNVTCGTVTVQVEYVIVVQGTGAPVWVAVAKAPEEVVGMLVTIPGFSGTHLAQTPAKQVKASLISVSEPPHDSMQLCTLSVNLLLGQ